LTLEEAIRINSESQKWDGVEEIKVDGTVVYTHQAYETMKEILGYECKEIRLQDTEERSKELFHLYNKAIEKYKT